MRLREQLMGKQRNWSKHCGGIVIWKDGMAENLILKDNQIYS